jgi:hypothetical protein
MRNELNTHDDFDKIVQRGIDFIQNYQHDPSIPDAYTPIPLSQDQLDELHKFVYAKSLDDLELDDRQ